METKAKPNPNGCLARALPDEPFLVFLARDLCGPAAIRFWADLRARLAVEGDGDRQDAEQLTEALATADAMELWRKENEGRWRLPQPEAAVWLIWSNEHGGWWKPGRWGYTPRIGEAGRYARSAADEVCRSANFGGQINEVAVLAPEAACG